MSLSPQPRPADPPQRRALRHVAEALGGQIVEGAGLGARDRVLLPHGPWTIMLDSEWSAASKSDWTRVRSAFAVTDPARLECRASIQRRNFLISDIARLLGAQDVVVGHEPFDRDFVIKGTDPEMVRAFLSGEELRERIAAEPRSRLSIREPTEPARVALPAQALEVRVDAPGGLTEASRLLALVAIVASALDRLRAMGVASDVAPTPARCPHCGHELLDQATCPECGKAVMCGQRT